MSPTRPELRGDVGMVASTHWLASAAGSSVLERGGNAFDAVVAAGFVLQVVEPHLNGPGGDSTIVLHSAADDRAHVVCGQGVSPAAATRHHFVDLGLDMVPGTGPLAATVPGSFGGWLTVLARWGTWELSDVLAYAIHHAEQGFPVLPDIHATIDSVADLFTDHWAPSAEVWLAAGRAPAAGGRWRSPGIASTYRRVLSAAVGPSREARLEAAARAWYKGFVAEAVGEFARHAWRDTSGRDHAGLLTADDLAGWRAGVESPVSVDVGDRHTVLKAGPWSQGPVLLQQLRLLSALGVPSLPARSAEWVHGVVECAKLAFADRDAFYGDPVDQSVPLDTLLSSSYAEQRAVLVGMEASREMRPGRPDGREPRLPAFGTSSEKVPPDAAAGDPTISRTGTSAPATRGDTCHVDVVDRWGNLVSATPSGGWLQSSPVIPALGFPLGTRGQMFCVEAGLPATIRPGVRPRSTLSPTLVLRDGVPWLACGTPGGDQQDQWQLTFLLDVLAAEAADTLDLQAAIDAPALHTTHFPSSFWPRESYPGQIVVESRLEATVIDALRARGHEVVVSGGWSLGRLCAVAREDGWLRAAADARSNQAYAIGR